MLTANEARQNVTNSVIKTYETPIFKNAVKKLENAIKEASSAGKSEISYNVAFFDISDPERHIEEHATQADRTAIEWFMKENGYHFFYRSMGNSLYDKNWFTCRW